MTLININQHYISSNQKYEKLIQSVILLVFPRNYFQSGLHQRVCKYRDGTKTEEGTMLEVTCNEELRCITSRD